jgi:hypothetical protein
MEEESRPGDQQVIKKSRGDELHEDSLGGERRGQEERWWT